MKYKKKINKPGGQQAKGDGASRGRSVAVVSGASTTPRPTKDNSKGPHPDLQRFLSVAVFTMALVADAGGMLGGPSWLKVGMGCATFAAGIVVLALRKRLSWVERPVPVSVALMLLGALVYGLGQREIVASARKEERASIGESCAAAKDYQELVIAAATKFVASSGRADEESQKMYNRADAELEHVTRAANRSGNDTVQDLARKMYLRSIAAAGYDGIDAGKATALQESSWQSFGDLMWVCSKAGFPYNPSLDWPIKPTVAEACKYFSRFIAAVNEQAKILPKTPSAETRKRTLVLLSLYSYHSDHTEDLVFREKARRAVDLTAHEATAAQGVKLVRDECVSRGFDVPPY